MSEIDKILYSKGTIKEILSKKIIEKFNSLDIAENTKRELTEGSAISDEAYDVLSELSIQCYNELFNEYVKNETIFKKTGNTNGNNIKNDYFKITSYSRSSGINARFRYDEDKNELSVELQSENSGASRFAIIRLKYNESNKSFINGSSTTTNTVYLQDISEFDFNIDNYIRHSFIKTRISEYNEILENKLKEMNEIKEKIGSYTYISNFMKDNSIEGDSLESIKTKMIMNTLEESKTDEVIDIETNINEIINLEV